MLAYKSIGIVLVVIWLFSIFILFPLPSALEEQLKKSHAEYASIIKEEAKSIAEKENITVDEAFAKIESVSLSGIRLRWIQKAILVTTGLFISVLASRKGRIWIVSAALLSALFLIQWAGEFYETTAPSENIIDTYSMLMKGVIHSNDLWIKFRVSYRDIILPLLHTCIVFYIFIATISFWVKRSGKQIT